VDQGEFDRRLRRAVTLVVSVCALVVALALMAVADGNGAHLRAQTALGPFLGGGGEPATVPAVPVETPTSRPSGRRAHKPAPASIAPAPAATISAAPPVERTPATLLVRAVEPQPPTTAAPTSTTPTTGPRPPTTLGPPTTTPGSTTPPPEKPPTRPPPTTVPPVTAGHGGHGGSDGGSGDDDDHERDGAHHAGHHDGDHDGLDHTGRDCPKGRRTS
jgi:hypothetical protein